MSRAVIVSTSSDALLKYWKKVNSHWFEKVDNIYIVDSRVGEHYPKNVEDKIREVKEDLLLIMHDDVFVYDKEILVIYFDYAEAGKVCSPIQASHSTDEVTEVALKKKFGNNWSFFPYFLFVSRENILKTSVNLHGYKTDKCPVLGVPTSGDQGYLLSLELRNTGTDIFPIARYLGHEYPIKPPWVHAQGLTYNLLSYNISVDEYKLAWLIKIFGLDAQKVRDNHARL